MKFKFLILSILISSYCFSQSLLNKNIKKHNFFVSIGAGTSFRTAKIKKGLTPSEESYTKDLNSGMGYDISFYYQKKSGKGLGLKYNSFRSKESGYSDEIGYFGENINISYYGASVFFTEDVDAKVGEFFFEFGLGYIHYKNDSYLFSNENMTFTGGNLGLSTSAAYHFRINKHILIGPQFAFTGGVLNKIDIVYSDGRKETVKLDFDKKESLYRIDLNVSAKIRF